MKHELIVKLHTDFELIVQKGHESATEYWLARDLQTALDYQAWRNFEPVIEKAITACIKSGYEAADHFARLRKMVAIGSKAQREVENIALTRYACYLIA